MQTDRDNDQKVISLEKVRYRAARCRRCGAKMYPTSLLKPHLTRHRRRDHRFNVELSKLRYIMNHMRDFAQDR